MVVGPVDVPDTYPVRERDVESPLPRNWELG